MFRKLFCEAVAAVMLLNLNAGICLSVFREEPYGEVIEKTAGMVNDCYVRDLLSQYGLNILNLTWEDTGRYKNSCVGPNISDMTIQVQNIDPRTRTYSLSCMPVIRYPNFSDKTGDISPKKFFLLVGNEKDKGLRKVSLYDFLNSPRRYLHDPDSWKGRETSLLAERDTHVLVSAQACFLPIPRYGKAEFNPVLFNYQSYKDNPAVLTIVATREGTSVTVIDNNRDSFSAGAAHGQRLFFNQNGERASLTGQRQSDYENPAHIAGTKPETCNEDKEGMNVVLLIQVPLKQKYIRREPVYYSMGAADMLCKAQCERASSNIENAVIKHGKVEGPFTEIADLDIERDPSFPIRVTVQFYKATSNGILSKNDASEIAKQIEMVYSNADYVGSLVTEGYTYRPTEYTGGKEPHRSWWSDFRPWWSNF